MKAGRKAGILAATALALGLMSPIELKAQEATTINSKPIKTQLQQILNSRPGINYENLSPSGNDYFWSREETDQSEKQKPADRGLDKKFWSLAAGLTAATTYDIETTYACINTGKCRESNPLMRPFIEAGRPASYGFAMGINTGIMYAAHRLRNSNNPSVKKLWWLIPVVAIGLHGTAGSLNLRYVF